MNNEFIVLVFRVLMLLSGLFSRSQRLHEFRPSYHNIPATASEKGLSCLKLSGFPLSTLGSSAAAEQDDVGTGVSEVLQCQEPWRRTEGGRKTASQRRKGGLL